MNSSDKNFIPVEMFYNSNRKIEQLILRLDEKQDTANAKQEAAIANLHTEILAVRELAIINSAKLDAYKDFMSTGFTIIAIVVAIVGISIPLIIEAIKFTWNARKERPQEQIQSQEGLSPKAREEVLAIAKQAIHDEFSAAVQKAVAEALGNFQSAGK